jgi:glycosyltransferase involved in cell wall biosynthesis
LSSPLHIVHGVLSLDVGGLERIVLSLTRKACQQGHRVSIVCVERRGRLGVEAEAEGATVVSLSKPPGRNREYVDRAAAALTALRPDVLHTHQIGAAWYLGRAAHSLGNLPVLHTEHGDALARSSSWWKAAKTRLLMWDTARFIQRFCCVSSEIVDAVTRWWTVPRAKVEVVANGIQAEVPLNLPAPAVIRGSLGIPEGAHVVGTVGRLTGVKQQDLLVRAVANIRERHPDIRLLIVGEGPERERLEVLSAKLGLTGRVHFAGYQPRPEEYLGVMTVFALTSRSEGFPVSLLEAWLAGIPTVCSQVGGIPNVVTHGVNGLLFPCSDQAALTSSLCQLLEDQSLRERLAGAGLRAVRDRYSIECVASAYEARYRELIRACTGEG